jgi:hypothetical protein
MNSVCLFFLTFLLVYSDGISGKYMSVKNHSFLQLKSDNTFIYESRFFHEYQHSTGRWSLISRGKVLLNSSIATSIDLDVAESENLSTGHNINTTVKIKNSTSLADYKCLMYINDSLKYYVACDSIPFIKSNKSIKSIYFIIRKEPINPSTTAISPGLITPKYKVRYAIGLLKMTRSYLIKNQSNYLIQ